MNSNRRTLLAAMGGTCLGSAVVGCLGDDGADYEDIEVADEHFDHLGVETFELLDRAYEPPEEMAYMHADHWHGSFHPIPHGDYLSIGAHAETEDGETIELGDEYELHLAVAAGASDGIVSFDHHGDHVHVYGEEEGVTELVALIVHDDHADYQSDRISVQVSDDAHHDDREDAHSHDDHDH